MKQIKKITAILLCFTMLFTVMPFSAYAADDRPTDPALIADDDKVTDSEYEFIELNHNIEAIDSRIYFQWNAETRTLYINGTDSKSTLTRIEFIYEKFYLYNEEELAEEAANGNNELGVWTEFSFNPEYTEHIVIGKKITTINGFGFNCPDLIDITAEANHPGIEIINSPVFFACDYAVNVPITNATLGANTFSGKTYDTVLLPSAVTEIGKECFSNADIRLIDLSQTNITVIPEKCFYGVKNLETVLLPPCIETIENRAFEASEIEYITLPGSVVSLGDFVFSGCTKLQSANLINIMVKKLKYTFSGCTSLKEVYLPQMLKSLTDAFIDCPSLKHLDIPDSVTSITGLDLANLTSFNFPPNLENLTISSIGEIEVLDLSNCTQGFRLEGFSAYNNQTLKEVIFPRENFGEIELNTFECCSNLEKITLYSCTAIGNNAFGETALTEVEIPDNCTLISDRAFLNCHNLTYVRMPMDLTVIDGGDPFEGCENLETVIYPSRNKLLFSDADAIARTKYSTRASRLHSYGFLMNENLTVYLYPDTEIEQYCIDYGINYAYIDWDLERNTDVCQPVEEEEKEFTTEGTIGNGTFTVKTSEERTKDLSCTLTAIEINANGPLTTTQMTCSNGTQTDIAEIMEHYELGYIKFMDGTTSIADGLFENFYEKGFVLHAVYFAPTVTTIGENAFRNSGVYSAYFSNGVSDVGEYAFADNPYLMSIRFFDSLSEIKEGTFYNTAVISVYFPEGLTKIGKKAFASFNRSHFDIADEPIGYETEAQMQIHEMRYYKGLPHTSSTVTTVNMVTGPFCYSIPATLTDIYYDPEHPEDNAFGVTGDGYVNDWIMFRVAYGSPTYQYVKMFGLRYTLYEGEETEEEINAPPLYDISNPANAEPLITGIVSTDEMIANKENSYTKWSYQPATKTLKIKSTSKYHFNSYNLYYSDGTKVQKGDFEVDTLKLVGSINKLFGAEYVRGLHSIDYFSTPISFFNPKNIDFSGVTMKYIYDEAFKDCTRLESITIPGSVVNLGSNLFENTPSLKRVIFEDGITEIPAGMFKNHKGLQFVDLPESLTIIGANTFNGCTDLQRIDIPDSCIAIGMNAFKSNINVIQVTLGSGLSQIGKDAFADLVNCEQITVKTDKIRTDATVTGIDYRVIFGNLGTLTNGITVTYADGLETADFKVFNDKPVTKIILGADISALKNADCLTALETIELSPDNSKYYLGDGALYTNKHILALAPRTIERFTVPQNCKGIGDNAFYGSALNSISIPGNVRYIGDYAFANSKNIKSVSLNKGTEEIGNYAFSNCDKLQFIFTPTNMDAIGDGAFRNCNKLSTVILNDELHSIGAYAFAECPALRGIVLPEHTETVGDYAFTDCASLEYAYIWNAQLLGGNVFLNDPMVRVYTVIGSDTYIWSREYGIPYVSYLDEDAFYTETMLKLDVGAGYLGYCEGEHGNIEWLTICDADCENDGYIIGVCEYCTELLEEVHIPALGHSYSLVTHVPATATQCAADIYRCDHCGDVYTVYEEQGGTTASTHTVSGTVVFADNANAESGTYAARSVAVQENGVTLTRTDSDGNFAVQLESGTHNLTLHYSAGFDRMITVNVGNVNVDCGNIPIIGCDFNRDGAIDSADTKLLRVLMFAVESDESYLAYADMSHDGIINSPEFAILQGCIGIDSDTYQYPAYIV